MKAARYKAIKDFFQKYASERKQWQEQLVYWRTHNTYRDRWSRIETLMGQMEEHQYAINEVMTTYVGNDTARIDQLHKLAKKSYVELRELMKPEWQQFVEGLVKVLVIAFFVRTYIFGLYHVPSGSAEVNLLVGDRIYGNKLAYVVHDVQRGDLIIFDNAEFVYDRNPIQRLWQKYIGFSVPFLFKAGPDNVVKRVIALPGDTVEGRVENGKPVIYLNGKLLDEPYVNPFPLIALEKETGFFDKNGIVGQMVPSFLHISSRQVNYSYDPRVDFEHQPYYNMALNEVLADMYTRQPALTPSGSLSYDRFGKCVDKFGPFTLGPDKYWVMGDSRLNSRDSRMYGFLDRKFIQGRAIMIIFSWDTEEPSFIFSLLKAPIEFVTKRIRWNRCFTSLYSVPDVRLQEPLPANLACRITQKGS